MPDSVQMEKELPTAKQETRELPDSGMETKELPDTKMKEKEIPDSRVKRKELPDVGNAENTVVICGELKEIKPTKLKYHRNRTAVFYRILELYPLMDILAMDAGAFGDDRDGDKATMDWLIAALDDEDFVVKHYDEMDTETIEKIISIFKRVNRLDEKEEQLKNRSTQRKGEV